MGDSLPWTFLEQKNDMGFGQMEMRNDNLNFSVNYPFNIYSVAMWHIRSHQKPCPKPTVVCPVGISVHGTVFFFFGRV